MKNTTIILVSTNLLIVLICTIVFSIPIHTQKQFPQIDSSICTLVDSPNLIGVNVTFANATTNTYTCFPVSFNYERDTNVTYLAIYNSDATFYCWKINGVEWLNINPLDMFSHGNFTLKPTFNLEYECF